MQERVRKLELKYKRYIIFKILKVLIFLIIFIACVFLIFYFYKMVDFQKELNVQIQKEKNDLQKKLNDAKIEYEKMKIIQEIHKNEVNLDNEYEKEKITIKSFKMNISNLKQAFYKQPSYDKALLLAHLYYQQKQYNKSIFWSLKANEIDKKNKDSWILFAQAKLALGDSNISKQVLKDYMNFYEMKE